MKKFAPIFFIFVIWAVFAAPFFVKSLTPFPTKYLVTFFSPWNSYPEFNGPVKNSAMPDVIGQIYPWKKFTIESLKQGIIPLWNPYSFSGTPHLANYQSAVLSPLNIGFFIFPFIDWWTTLVLLQPLLAGLFTYLFVKSLKRSVPAALVSSISFMFCGFLTTWMGYATLGYAILFLPFALFSIEQYFQSKKSLYLFLLFLSIPLSFFSGHFQISIYFLLFLVCFILFKYVSSRDFKTTVKVGIAVLFGILASSPQLFPSVELYSQSFRSGIFQKTEVIPWNYLPTLLAPDFFGNPVTGNGWFGHYAEWNAYTGVVALFLALYSIFALLKKRSGVVIFFLLSALISFFLAFQSPLLDLLVFLRVPVLSTSALSRVIVLFSFSIAVLAGFGMDSLLLDIKSRKFKARATLLFVFGLLFVVLWVIVVFKLFIPMQWISVAKSNLMLPSALFAGLAALLLFPRFIKTKHTKVIVIVGVLCIVSFDMYRFVTKWQPYDLKNQAYPLTPITRFYSQISGYARVYGNFGAEDNVYYNLPGVDGYDALYIRRYGQFIASLEDGKLHDSARSVVGFPKNGKYFLLGANFLGVNYIVHKTSDAQNVWAFPFWKYDLKTIKLLFNDGHYQVLENTNAYPRAYLASSIKAVFGDQDILDTMLDSKFDLRNAAVIEENLKSNIESSGSAQVTSYQSNKISIKTSSIGNSFLVLTDTYYPGWVARIDGRETKIYRTDFTFRGVVIPAGSHSVVFSYEPASFRYGIYAAILGLVGLVVLVFFDRRKK